MFFLKLFLIDTYCMKKNICIKFSLHKYINKRLNIILDEISHFLYFVLIFIFYYLDKDCKKLFEKILLRSNADKLPVKSIVMKYKNYFQNSSSDFYRFFFSFQDSLKKFKQQKTVQKMKKKLGSLIFWKEKNFCNKGIKSEKKHVNFSTVHETVGQTE